MVRRAGSPASVTSTAGACSHMPETWRRVGAVGQVVASASLDATDQVDADVDLACRPLAGREQPVEGDDAVDLGGRHVEAFGDVVDRCRADPAHPVVDGVQGRQQQVTACSERPAADPVVRTRRLVGPECTRRSAARSAAVGSMPARLQVHGGRRTLTAGADRAELLDAHGGGLELGGARLRVGGVDREQVRVDLVGEVERHEHEARTQAAVDADRGARSHPRGDVTRHESRRRRGRAVRASSGETSIVSPSRFGLRYPPDCTPVLYESSRRPVVSRIGNSSVSRLDRGIVDDDAERRRRPRVGGVVGPEATVEERRLQRVVRADTATGCRRVARAGRSVMPACIGDSAGARPRRPRRRS